MYLYYVLFFNILYHILIHQYQMINNQGLIQKLGMMVHIGYKSQQQYYDVDQ
ncbi:unnamed protein product [Paramecium primaurelia]|uniref:Uncharacterized protein n=1 Tax=Paramecium primaurelia TaxID=5886 RepID=A0A8S1MQJ5_PARPR|nr:unnamed protein product [Paramecium primaurelia]